MIKPYAISISHLSASYGDIDILKNISLLVPQGVCCAVVGPNGAGKTTLLSCMLSLHKSLGKINFFGHPFQEVRSRVAYVPQRKFVDWTFPITVFDVVLMGAYAQSSFRKVSEEIKIQVYKALELVEMQQYADVHIAKLSGGQQQRIFIARALMQQADLYLLDEPFAGVDKKTEHMLVQLFTSFKYQDKTLFVVHHDWHTLGLYFDWVVYLNKKLIYAGPFEQKDMIYYIEQTYGEA